MAEDKSRVQGNEVNHQEFCDEYQHRDKKNGFSMKVVEDHTCASRVQGIEVKPQDFKHRDENTGFNIKMAED